MNLELSNEQQMLKKTAREFANRYVSKPFVREMEENPQGFTPEMWKEMANLGWQGWIIPEQYGGLGDTFMNLAVLIEEMGRACVPGPFFSTVILGAATIMDAGSEQQKADILPKIATGDAILTMALLESSTLLEAKGIETKAVHEGNHYVINGTKLFVSDANVADSIICVAKTGKGITLFLVDAKTAGVKVTLQESLAGDKLCEVTFENVKVPVENVIGKADHGWEVVEKTMQRAAVAKCLEMVGGAQRVLEMTVEYANQRVQFDQPIAKFQAIQHHCANMAIEVEGSRLITYEAAWMVSEGMPAAKQVAMAKAFASKGYRKVVAIGHQVHGTIGYTKEHDMQLYFRRAKAGELAFGDTYFHLNRVGLEMGV